MKNSIKDILLLLMGAFFAAFFLTSLDSVYTTGIKGNGDIIKVEFGNRYIYQTSKSIDSTKVFNVCDTINIYDNTYESTLTECKLTFVTNIYKGVIVDRIKNTKWNYCKVIFTKHEK